MEPAIKVNALPVVGLAAADDSHFQRTEFFQEITETLHLPKNLKLVRIKGESMSPVIMDGQWVMVDEETAYPPRGSIVVAQIRERDGRMLEEFEYYCKRAFINAGQVTLLSINVGAGSPPFTSSLEYCRLWPVIGVYFGGQGKAPV